MALPDNAHATLAELKVFMPRDGAKADELLRMETALGRASAMVDGEGLGGRRTVYRGPVSSYNDIAAAQTIANGTSTVTIAGAPNSAGRTLVVRKTDPDRGITAGILTVSQASPVLTETFDLSLGDVLHGIRFFTGAVTAALTGVAGAGSGDTLEIGTSEGYSEFYSPCAGAKIIKPREWPVRNYRLYEDADRVFGVDTLLVAGTDYELRNAESILRAFARLSDGADSTWLAGTRTQKGFMSAGYRGTGEVPQKIKGVTLELAAWMLQRTTGMFGLTSNTDGMGSRSVSGPPILTTGMKADLGEFYRSEVMPTAERGWSEVAA